MTLLLLEAWLSPSLTSSATWAWPPSSTSTVSSSSLLLRCFMWIKIFPFPCPIHHLVIDELKTLIKNKHLWDITYLKSTSFDVFISFVIKWWCPRINTTKVVFRLVHSSNLLTVSPGSRDTDYSCIHILYVKYTIYPSVIKYTFNNILLYIIGYVGIY